MAIACNSILPYSVFAESRGSLESISGTLRVTSTELPDDLHTGVGTVCIVAAHPLCLSGLEGEPRTHEFWGLNTASHFGVPYTRWFQIHPWEILLSRPNLAMDVYIDWLNRAQFPVYLDEAQTEIPKSIRYPREDVAETIGSNYFQVNTIAYMVALAIHEGFQEIKIYGVGMSSNDVGDGYARPCIEYLLGLARGRGIKVWVHPKSALLKADLYAQIVDPSYLALHKALDILRYPAEHMKYSDEKVRLDRAIVALEELYLPLLRNKADGSLQ